MTDEQNWQAPGTGPVADPGAPGHPAPPTAAQQPVWGAPSPQPAWAAPFPQPAWAPPPKPGLIPLRPLGFGTLIGAPFQVIRRNPKITVGAALLIHGLPSLVAALLISGGVFLLADRAVNASAGDRSALTAGAVGGTIVLGLVAALISGISGALLQGVIVGEVARGTVGEKLSFRSLWRLVKGRIGALIGWTFLITLGWIVAVAIVALAAAGLLALGPAGIGAAIAFIIFAFFAMVAVAIWFFTKASLVPSAIVLERLPIRAALPRSWRLTQGYFWRTFGVIALIWVIVYMVTQIIATPFGLLGGLVGGILAPTSASENDPSAFAQLLVSQFGVNILSTVVTSIVGAILAVVQTSAVALIYIDLRMRKEGLDLELTRFVEARQTGQELADPYLAPARQPVPASAYPPPGGYPPAGSYPPPASYPPAGSYPPPGSYPPGPPSA